MRLMSWEADWHKLGNEVAQESAGLLPKSLERTLFSAVVKKKVKVKVEAEGMRVMSRE